MKVKVVIPWRPEKSRLAGFNWVCSYYRHRLGNDSVHVEEDRSSGPFNKSKLVNSAALNYPDHTLVIADADCFICDFSLMRAVRECPKDKMILPHNCLCKMRMADKWWLTNRFSPDRRVRGRLFRKRRSRAAPGGIWVIHYDLFSQQPMDERFEGWGSEDGEYISRVPHTRYSGPLFHIPHVKQSRAHARKNGMLRRLAAEEQAAARRSNAT